ncbi:FG-GAP-like repeat-containing protein [Novipirellula sp.]|uniref:FG-GAP-like repeat-containing protein n=1 Tax=Novipirellula sp. TaxID=2795430 RepID=UPI003568E4FD
MQDQAPDPAAEMRRAMSVGDWGLANQFSEKTLIAQPNDPAILADVARVMAMNQRRREAALLMVEATTLASYQPESQVDFTVQALIDVGEIYVAIDFLKQAVQVDPKNAKLRRQLVGFLGETLRTQEIQPHLLELFRQRQFDIPLLVTVTETSSRRFLDNFADMLLQRKPADRRVRLSEAYERFSELDFDASESVLMDILEHHPDFAPAQTLYGQVLVKQRRFDEFTQWAGSVSANAKVYPEYWLALGDWANEQKRFAESCHAYWKATQCNPNLAVAWSSLAQSLGSLAEPDAPTGNDIHNEQLQDIGQRISQLIKLHTLFFDFNDDGRQSQQGAVKVAQCLMNLGRNWEAEAWTAVATTLTQDPSQQLTPLREEIHKRLKQDPSWQSKRGQLALSVNLDDFPSVVVNRDVNTRARVTVVPPFASTDHLRLTDQSKQWGLESVGGENNPDEDGLAPLIHTNGVGGGAIDYDLDGWPDLIVMGAGGMMLRTDSKPNELLRNVGTRFVKVTSATGVGDTGFGQGVASGDFNEDGFPDLFFANLGENRLLRNNGDGTFTDCTERLGDSATDWTTNASFFDINGDGYTDLFVTNYCDTVPAVGQACLNEEGMPGPCHPLNFPASGDQVLVAQSDGQFKDVTKKWMPKVSTGRGLGMIAGALDGKTMGVLIANDMSANHYYTFDDDKSQFSESAAIRGLAVDGRAMPQASMGIAASDFDNDGDLEFYVTGFSREYNIFYEQISPGFWRDETSRMKLVQPTLMTVGFGTQAIDLDNDGVQEIAVTNGHIGEFNDPKHPPYKQPFQLFSRSQQGAFKLLKDDAWGEYFRESHVGRAMWTLDVNRDGNQDLLITHAYEPICLLVNQTQQNNHKIAFRLVGTLNQRDAVGAVVRFDCGSRQQTLWALAGDGYLCCNQKVLRAGLGEVDQVCNVTVTWQNGNVDKLGTLDADSEYLVVQGTEVPFKNRL